MLEPPKDVAPDVLFRRLCQLPRPGVSIGYRIRGAEQVALSVRAVRAAEAHCPSPELISEALWTGSSRAFPSAEAVTRLLGENELAGLSRAVEAALGLCSPLDGLSEWRPWHQKLLEGARHVSNRTMAYSLGSQFDIAGRLVLDRPERYFGVPACDLVDAHWFAYRAARAYFFECQSNE